MMVKRSSLVLAAALLALPALASANRGGIKSRETETERAGVKIALYEKWSPSEEKSWKQNGKVILLVHGATWSSRCTFDSVEGYSMMDTLAEQGWDVWALDIHGYGHSGKTNKDWSEAVSAAEDIDAAADYIRALRWVEKVHVFGYQWGAQAASMFAEKKPSKVAKLILFGMRYQLTEKKAQPQEQYRVNSNANAMLKPEDGDLDVEFVRRRAQVCLEYDKKSPNGALSDITQPAPADPAKVRAPTLMIMGEKDADQTVVQDRLEFFRSLGSRTKMFSVLSGLGKYATFEKNRAKFETSVISFLELP